MDEQLLLFTAKIIISAGMVITITLVAERASTRFAGVLLGFPLGAGLTFFFTGIEQGALFAAQSTPWSIQGLSATLIFCLLYQHTASRMGSDNFLGLAVSTCIGVSGFFATAYILQYVLQGLPVVRMVGTAAVFVGAALFFRRWPSPAIEQRVATTKMILLGRASFAAITILSITAAASLVGPRWTGIFAAFPTTVLPTILVLHYHYGSGTTRAVFREIPLGMLAIVVFSIAVYFSFPLFGVYLGIVISYLAATLYLFLYEMLLRSFFDDIFDKYCRVQ